MTAVRPRRRLLITMPLLLAVAALTMAATRTPSARAPFFRRQSAVALTPKAITGGARQFPRLATPESLPPISVTWENASIGDVVATFASFAHRRILAASDVNIPITGSVVHEPWFVALEAIMTRNGLRVEVRADSSIYISLPRKAEPRSLHGSGAVQMSRMVRGNIYDAFTGAPIANARINVAGVQLIGEPNETWSNDEGHFSLRVPDGEVWLDASAPGYPSSRVVLAATDTVAVFRERRLDDCLPDTYNADSTGTRELRHEIVPMYSGIFLIDGVPLGSPESRRPQVHCGKSPARTGTVQIRTF